MKLPIESGLTKSEETKFFWNFFVVVTKSFFLSIPEFFKWFISLFAGKKIKNISGQLALITGGSSGIGKAIAFRFAKEGCTIAIADINYIEGMKVAAEIQSKYKVNAKAFQIDVSKANDVEKLKIDVEKSLGQVDILVNNAGLLSFNLSLLEGTNEDVQNIIDVNLTSHFWVSLDIVLILKFTFH
jgi:all-trans-retinol dehydrogenase (NAD+)